MKPCAKRFLRPVLGALLAAGWPAAGCDDGPADADAGADDAWEADGGEADGGVEGDAPDTLDAPPEATPDAPTTTVRPAAHDEVLNNPGMGFADFHFGAESLPPEAYPPQSVAYLRWTWADLEPSAGEYDFARVDRAVALAREEGKSLAFRIMPVWQNSTPRWLLDLGVDSVAVEDGVFPDHNHPLFLEYHERLVRAFGARYAGDPDIDHVDIGSVGCWGEWNTACCGAAEPTCLGFYPTEAHQTAIIDWYVEAFAGTPLVMLIGGPVEYAVGRGAGWRGDCFGDYGMFSASWNHMEDLYGPAAEDPVVGNAWRTAPVQFESCGVMQDWYDRGFDIDLILQRGLDWHMSVFNAKSSPVPAAWRARVDEFLKRVGYRLVLVELTHTAAAAPGGALRLVSRWENRGVAPVYHPWPLAYRLRSGAGETAAQWTSGADLRTWLPGAHDVEDVVTVPAAVEPGSYALDVGVLTEDGREAHVLLGNEGARPDRWHAVSSVAIVAP